MNKVVELIIFTRVEHFMIIKDVLDKSNQRSCLHVAFVGSRGMDCFMALKVNGSDNCTSLAGRKEVPVGDMLVICI